MVFLVYHSILRSKTGSIYRIADPGVGFRGVYKMVGIGHCEVKKCGNRTNKRFCREHRRPEDREDLLLVGESKSLDEFWWGRVLLWVWGKL